MQGPLIDTLARQGVTRRSFFKYCATLASLMALPPSAGRAMAEAMAAAPAASKRPSVIWLPFQECTGCTESITRSHSPSIEGLIFDAISLDYQETLMAAAGHQAEEALHKAMKENEGKYLLVIDGSVALGMDGAYSCIAGYSCFNDGSIRQFQRRTAQWDMGKNFDRTGGFGPWMVTADELPEGAKGLKIETRLNGQVLQSDNTANMIFPVAETLVDLTQAMTLMPGDIIVTGTPSGVGHARKPPLWMKHGDVCEIDIEGVGILVNPIEDEKKA